MLHDTHIKGTMILFFFNTLNFQQQAGKLKYFELKEPQVLLVSEGHTSDRLG
jgi:hypothetical protein